MSYEYPQENQDSRENVLPQISFINKVYGTMTIGLLLTAFLAYHIYTSVAPETMVNIWMPCAIVEIILVFAFSFVARKCNPVVAFVMFLGYAALNGVTLSTIFYVYKLGSIATAFMVTGGTFAAMTLYGVTTRRDLTSLGNLCFMALIGILIASIVNIFLKSTGLEFAISILGVIIFVGLTAYDTKKIKDIGDAGCNHSGVAVIAALELYLDFINLFLYIVRLMGKRK